VNTGDLPYTTPQKTEDLEMKKLLVFIMALAMTLSLAACGGSDAAPTTSPSTSVQVENTEFTAEQQALAQDFMSMAEEFDAIADKVNASPELLENEELVTAMNDLSSEIIKADEYFASPETLTPEVMGALTVAIEVGRSFIAEAGAALNEVSQ
jgi:membrane-bound lytic murein transglycosylase B